MLKILLFICLSFNANAKKQENIFLLFTGSMQPYLNESNDSGIEYEIIKSALEAVGLNFSGYQNVHYQRAIKLLGEEYIDGVVANMANEDYIKAGLKVHNSNMTLEYVDCAISLRKNKFNLSKMSAFSNKKIWAFKSARHVLGKEFQAAVKNNPNYTENPEQKLQLKMLLSERIDIAISDKNIFLSVLSKEIGEKNKKLFNFNQIIPATPRNVKFKSQELGRLFNKGLKTIQSNGKMDKIIKKYKKSYIEKC